MGSSGSGGVDKKYNARMAELAEMASSQALLSEHERKYGFKPGGFQSQMDKQVYNTTTNSDGTTVPVINRKALSGTVAGNQASQPVTSAAEMLNKYSSDYGNGK